jgi:hemolysin activation/secretion protein
MTTFGGLYTVRGYEEDEIVADGGVLASLEYRYGLTKALRGEQDDRRVHDGRRSSWVDMSLLGFTDFGRPEIKDPEPGEFDRQDMWGVGLGMLFEVGDDFQAGIYHSWALQETQRGDGSTITDSGDSQWNFNFIYRW